MNFNTIKMILSNLGKVKSILPPPLREILSEADGTGSYSRTTGFMIIMTVLLLLVYLVIKNHTFPDMTGPTMFVAGGAGTGYGINQIKNIAAAAKSGTAAGTPPPGAPPDANQS
jgi:Na+/melibiose symporter-like transporter